MKKPTPYCPSRQQIELVSKVCEKYLEVNPYSCRNPQRLIEFAHDVDMAIKAATANGSDAERLREAWRRFQRRPNEIDPVVGRMIVVTAPVLASRGLHPGAYFKKSQLGGLNKRPSQGSRETKR